MGEKTLIAGAVGAGIVAIILLYAAIIGGGIWFVVTVLRWLGVIG